MTTPKGRTSFEDLRTVSGQVEGAVEGVIERRVMATYKKACVAHRLTDDDDELNDALTEATQFDTAKMLRGLSVTFCLSVAQLSH